MGFKNTFLTESGIKKDTSEFRARGESSPQSFKFSLSGWSLGDNDVDHIKGGKPSKGVPKVIGELTAQFDFNGVIDKDLPFAAGEKIGVLKVREKDWWFGINQ